MSPDQPQLPRPPHQTGPGQLPQYPQPQVYPPQVPQQPVQPQYPYPQPQMPQPQQPQVQQLPTQPSNYDFIMNPSQPTKAGFKLPGGSANSMAMRVGLIAGGLIVLVIIFAIVKSIVVKGPDMTGYIGVAQDQTEILHLVSSNNNLQSLSDSNQNVAATLSAVIASNQTSVLTYIKEEGQKINTKQIDLKLNANLDKELSNAQAAGTYDSAFSSAIQDELAVYTKDLATTYKAGNTATGQTLLKQLYKQAQLLQIQASSASSAGN